MTSMIADLVYCGSRTADCGSRLAAESTLQPDPQSTIHVPKSNPHFAIRVPQPSVRYIRNEGDLARALDCRLQLPLMHRAGARDAPRQDLAPLEHEGANQTHVLVIDVVDLVRG